MFCDVVMGDFLSVIDSTGSGSGPVPMLLRRVAYNVVPMFASVYI
jgi:hypothetical protein